MRNHNSLGHAGSSAGINKSRTIARLCFIHSGIDKIFVQLLSYFHKLSPMHYFASPRSQVSLGIIVENNITNLVAGKLVKILFRVFHIFCDHQSAIRVFGYKVADLLAVGCVDPGGNRASKEAAVKSDAPLHGVESNDVDGAEFRKLERDKTGSKVNA